MPEKNHRVFARCPGTPYDANNQKVVACEQEGISIRDWATIECAKGILSNPNTNVSEIPFAQIANKARRQADAILKDLSENP